MDPVVTWIQEFFRFKKLTAHSKKMQESLRDDLMDWIEEAVEAAPSEEHDESDAWTDGNGSQFIRLPQAVVDPTNNKEITVLKREKRVAKILDEDRARVLLEKQGLLDECITMIPVLDEEAILALNFEGKLHDDDLKSLYDEKVTWAFTQKES